MLGIFKDERRGTGPIPVNPAGTARGSSPDGVAKSLKCRTLRRFPRLAGDDPRAASTTTLYEYTPSFNVCNTIPRPIPRKGGK